MQTADSVLNIYRERGRHRRPLDRVYRQLFNPDLWLRAYGKTYRNPGAMTKGVGDETVDGMSLGKIQALIETLRAERWNWSPVRRVLIPKANGKTRPLGIPRWSDRLLQEVLRSLLEAYYEPQFRDSSHGFRPGRSCHTALLQIQKTWKGTSWFIEGDIKGCFDNISHDVLIGILKRDIHDGRLIELLRGALKAGYMEAGRLCETRSGSPQGGIASPLLANVYLNELDRFVEDELAPAYTRGKVRKPNPEYQKVHAARWKALRHGDGELAARLRRDLRKLSTVDPLDPDFRRLKYVRYADDFLMGFIGPRREAEEIRDRVRVFLKEELDLDLSEEKTLITHATDDKAHFLGYELSKARPCDYVSGPFKKRNANGVIQLRMPREAVVKVRKIVCGRGGKPGHRPELVDDQEYTIVQKYQSILRGIYNYYRLALNVGRNNRMPTIKWLLETSLLKTLSVKRRSSVAKVRRALRVYDHGKPMLRAVVEREGKRPLVAKFGGIPFVRDLYDPWMLDLLIGWDWDYFYSCQRSETVDRMLAGKCELCGAEGDTVMHHIRGLRDIDRPGRRPKTDAERVMAARRRKSLPVCTRCHWKNHTGRYDGPRLRQLPESRMR